MPSTSSPSHPFARPVGYAIVLAALVGLFVAGAFLMREATRAPHTIRIHFPEISTLAEGDPVVQGGVPVGKVTSIRLPPEDSGNREALVEVELFTDHPLAADARFVNFSHSLMGARKVWIQPGTSSLPLDESRVQEGIFAPGISETMHKVDSLVVIIARLRQETERLLTEDNPLRSPVAAARRLDTAAQALDRLTGRLESARAALDAGIAGFSAAARDARLGARAAEPPLNQALVQSREWIQTVEAVEKNLDSVLTRVEKITALANDTTHAGKLLNSRVAYDQLEQSVRLLEQVSKILEKDGLTDSMKIRPRLRKPK